MPYPLYTKKKKTNRNSIQRQTIDAFMKKKRIYTIDSYNIYEIRNIVPFQCLMWMMCI